MRKDILNGYKLRLLGIVVVILLFVLVIVPKAKEVLNERNKIKEQKTRIEKLSQKLKQLRGVSREELFDSRDLLLSAIPLPHEFFKVVLLVKRTIEENGLFLTSLNIANLSMSSNENVMGLKKVEVQVSFLGSLENLINFIEDLKRKLPLTRIENLKLGIKEEGKIGMNIRRSLEEQRSLEESDIFTGSFVVLGYFSPVPEKIIFSENQVPSLGNKDKEIIEKLKSYSVSWFGGKNSEEEGGILVGKEDPFH